MPRVSRVLALSVLGVAVFGLAGCSMYVEKDDLEEQVSSSISQQGMPVDSVDCPDDLDGEVDATTTCTVTVQGGTEVKTDITVTSVDGDEVRFDITPQQTAGE
ncbi:MULTISPECIES: DUF4333 domain-containing protein [Prauserella salsuginis group]|uniref:NAD(P)H-hydrate repair Nnr-like enzyme with NAD(P)H-hydrate epimerase domain n=2 Tax=Prauserella salsuginis group TaxID=2893672 RepID=A0A839XIP3_9PSEU|nr:MULTISPECIES: DUF4333 domain-containing protein [Prauserella salsuginis group]MBB3661434.1 NAD(P)H-hydrate repair Nnr-like enzyme with NAD(P)H-hydrate epimerase domain [Prauserella sediminis]MCR3719355.1 protein of unknown function (DUF4333) [Prauserella flava]MCR3735631.1 protein of unknown function (DUF4333) [Prauserella salsuginis]